MTLRDLYLYTEVSIIVTSFSCAQNLIEQRQYRAISNFKCRIKNRIMNTLRNNISQFQNAGIQGKGVADKLFIIRHVIDHSLYLVRNYVSHSLTLRHVLVVDGWKTA